LFIGSNGIEGRGAGRCVRACIAGLALLALLSAVFGGGARAAAGPETTEAGGAPVALEPPPGRPRFSFAFTADYHLGSKPGNENGPLVIEDLGRLQDGLDFVVAAGDLTEIGSEAEYRLFDDGAALLDVPVYRAAGNHETCWLDPCLEEFCARYGPARYSFDVRGVHFVVLDTSVPGRGAGFLEAGDLAWLKEDLAAVDGDAPVVVFSHHPLVFPDRRFVENEMDFLEAVGERNVVATFAGHGHSARHDVVNGIHFFMTPAAMDGGYVVVDVHEDALVVYWKRVGAPRALEGVVPTARPVPTPRLEIASPGRGASVGEGFIAEVRVGGFGGEGDVHSVEYRVDSAQWTPMERGPDGTYRDAVEMAEAAGGFHVLEVRARLQEGLLMARREFRVEDERLSWRWRAPGSVRGSPVIHEAAGAVYVASADGSVHALRLSDGSPLWSFRAGGAVEGSPTLVGDVLYFGSADGNAYAVDARSGGLLWARSVGSAVTAEPHVYRDLVCFPTTDGDVVALDSSTGEERWRYGAAAAVVTRPAAGAGRIYFGSWDGALYAVDAATGEMLWKRSIARQVYYSPATAPPLFYMDKVYVVAPPDPHAESIGLWAFGASTGETVWRTLCNAARSAPIGFDGRVAACESSGRIVIHDALTGEVERSIPTGTPVAGRSPIRFGTDLVLGGSRGRVVAVDRAGEVAWQFSTGAGPIYGRPAAWGGGIVVACADGWVYSIGARPTAGEAAETEAGFRDVTGHWAEGVIARIASMGLVSGYEDGTFRPQEPITRAELAALLARYLGVSAVPEGFESRLADIEGHWAAGAVAALEAREVVLGEEAPDGTMRFRPNDRVNRAEAAAMIARARGMDGPSPGFQSALADVGETWARPYIEALEEEGLIRGYRAGDGVSAFGHARSLTRAETAALMSRLIS